MVDFSAFQALNPGGRSVIRNLRGAARRAADAEHDPWLSFILLWMSFNGWMTTVTGLERDAQMIEALERDHRIAEAFVDAMRDPELSEVVSQFAEWWPIFSVKHIRRRRGAAGFYNFRYHQDLYDAYINDIRIQRRPLAWVRGQEPRWADLIWACYQVRCNLFHGDKDPYNEADQQIVEMAYGSICRFLELSNLYDWS